METFCKVILKKVGLRSFLYNVGVGNRRSFLSKAIDVGLEIGINPPPKKQIIAEVCKKHQFGDK